MEAVGANGRITVEGENVIISRKGTGLLTLMNQGLQGDKTIPLHNITAIQLKEPGMARGYLRLSINGRDPVGGVFEAVKDENAVMFDKQHLSDFVAMKDFLQKKISEPRTTNSVSLADEIEKLASLRDRGILTNEEFSAKKKQLLNL